MLPRTKLLRRVGEETRVSVARLVGAIVALVLVLGPSTGSAQADKRGPRKVIHLDTLTIEGKIQKPQAFYILQRSNLNFGELERVESFLPKVVKSVDRSIF
jgi:hypothetical protein